MYSPDDSLRGNSLASYSYCEGDLLPAELEELPKCILVRMRFAAGLTIVACLLIGGLLIYGKFIK